MKGILADVNVVAQVAYLVGLMQAEPWTEFWQELGLVLRRFEDVGLSATAKDGRVRFICWVNPHRKQALMARLARVAWERVHAEAERRGFVAVRRRLVAAAASNQSVPDSY